MDFKNYILNILNERQSDIDFNSLANKYFDEYIRLYIKMLNDFVEDIKNKTIITSEQLVTHDIPFKIKSKLRENKIDWNELNKELLLYCQSLTDAYSSSSFTIWLFVPELNKTTKIKILSKDPDHPNRGGLFHSNPFSIDMYDNEIYKFYIKPITTKINFLNLINILIETYKSKMIEDDVLSVYNTIVIPDFIDDTNRTISALTDLIKSRLKHTFIHEFRHFYDQVKYKGLHREKFDQERYDAGDTSTNQEYNAYYTTLADIVMKYTDLVKDSSDPIHNLSYQNYEDRNGTDTETFRNTLKRIKEDSLVQYKKVIGRLSTLINKIKTER